MQCVCVCGDEIFYTGQHSFFIGLHSYFNEYLSVIELANEEGTKDFFFSFDALLPILNEETEDTQIAHHFSSIYRI